MNLNKFSFAAVLLFSLLSITSHANSDKWWQDWVAALTKSLQKDVQPQNAKKAERKANNPRSQFKKGPVEDSLETKLAAAFHIARQLLRNDKFKIWEINSGGESCQADAVYIRDLMRSGAFQESLIALLLVHHTAENAGRRFEPTHLIDNLVAFGLLTKKTDMNKKKAEGLLKATRLAYMRMMVTYFGQDPNEILEPHPDGPRFRVKAKHKLAFYKEVFRAFRDGPVVLALYEGFPVLEKTNAFTGVKYLFVFDFDGHRWILRTKSKDVNIARLGLGPYLALTDEGRVAYTMNPNTRWLSPGFVDEGIGPEDGESFIVTHVGGLWRPSRRKPTKSFVEEIGLTQLELESYLIESVRGRTVGESSSVVKFSILHHNFIQKHSKSFFENIRSFSTQPTLMAQHDQGAPIQIDGQAYPYLIQNNSQYSVNLGFRDIPDFTVTSMINKKAYILRIPSKQKGESFIHDFSHLDFTVVNSDQLEERESGTVDDWDAFIKAIKPYVSEEMAPRAIEEFARVGMRKENFVWWATELRKYIADRDAKIDFPDIEPEFVKKGSLMVFWIEGSPYRITDMKWEDSGLRESRIQSLATNKIRLCDGRVVGARLVVPKSEDDDEPLVKESKTSTLWATLGISEKDYLATAILKFFDEDTDPQLAEWILSAIRQVDELTFSNDGYNMVANVIPGEATHWQVLSRLYGVRLYAYALGETGVFERIRIVDTSQIEQPKARHILCRSKNKNGEYTRFDRIAVYEDVYECAREHPPGSRYRGPRNVGNTINTWLKLYEPGRDMVHWTTPTLTSHELDCLTEVKKAISKDSFLDPAWIATLPAKVIGLFFDARLLNGRQIFEPAHGFYNKIASIHEPLLDERQKDTLKIKPEVVHISRYKFQSRGAKKAVDHMNRIFVHEHHQSTPQILERVTPAQRDSENLTALEEDCLKEVKRVFAEGLFHVRWLATLPPRVITRMFELGLLDDQLVFDPELDRHIKQQYPIYDTNNPQVNKTIDQEASPQDSKDLAEYVQGCVDLVLRASSDGIELPPDCLRRLPQKALQELHELSAIEEDDRGVIRQTQNYPDYDPNNPPVGVSIDRNTGEPHLVWDDTAPEEPQISVEADQPDAAALEYDEKAYVWEPLDNSTKLEIDDHQPYPQRASEDLTALERDCLDEIERGLATTGIDVRWIATLPPMIIQRIFVLGLI